jgi:tripartite-type tricarboxylate transporter receptor subunit TctC
MRRTLIAATIAMFGIATPVSLAGPALAQTYPDRLIRMIVPFPPGGPVDTIARIVTQGLPQILGQTIVIENRAGASGTIGARAVAASPADGYTLLFGNISSLVVTPVVTNNRDFDPDKTFTAVAKTSQNYEVLVVHPDFPAKSVRELVAYAKANPGKLNFGSAGIGNATHLAAELFKQRTGVDIVHVPYKGAFEAVTGVMAGQVQMFFGDIGGVLPLIREGRVRALALSSETRSADLPTLPTMIESGVPGYVVLTYTGVVAPAATPPEIVQKLNAALNASLQTPEAAASLRRIGAESVPSSPQDFAAFLSAERDKWREVVRHAGIKIE